VYRFEKYEMFVSIRMHYKMKLFSNQHQILKYVDVSFHCFLMNNLIVLIRSERNLYDYLKIKTL